MRSENRSQRLYLISKKKHARLWKKILIIVIAFVLIVTVQNSSYSVPPDNTPPEPDSIRKYDRGFYEKISTLIDKGKTHEYEVIILVKKTPEGNLDAKSVAKKNKDNLAVALTKNHNVKNLYKAQILSFITASVPIPEIPKLADYDYVFGIGDGESPIFPLSANMDNAKFNINAENLLFNGTGVNVAIIDTGIRQDHSDLPVGTKIVIQARFCVSCPYLQ